MKLDGQVALVTGPSGGIGRAIARRLTDEGATVALGDGHHRVAANRWPRRSPRPAAAPSRPPRICNPWVCCTDGDNPCLLIVHQTLPLDAGRSAARSGAAACASEPNLA